MAQEEEKKEVKTKDPLSKVFKNITAELIPSSTIALFSALLVFGASWLLQNFYTEIQTRDLEKLPKFIGDLITMVFQFTLYATIFTIVFGPALLYAIKTKKWESFVYIALITLLLLAIFLTAVVFFAPKAAANPYLSL